MHLSSTTQKRCLLCLLMLLRYISRVAIITVLSHCSHTFTCPPTSIHRQFCMFNMWGPSSHRASVLVPRFMLLVASRGSCCYMHSISTTNLAACVCVCAKCDQFLPARFYFESKRPENFVRIAKFPYAAFGPLFAFHCPLFFTRNNDLEWKSSRFAVIVRSSVADKQLA